MPPFFCLRSGPDDWKIHGGADPANYLFYTATTKEAIMSMGYGANYADVVADQTVQKIVGKKLLDDFMEKYEAVLDSDELTLFDITDTLNDTAVREPDKVFNDDSPTMAALRKAWHAVHDKFKEQTDVDLLVGFHSKEDEGDRYDEVDGLYFCIYPEDLYQPTPAYLKMMERFGEDVVERKFYVSFG